MHTICGMCGVFSYIAYRSRGNPNSGCLECTFLPKFSINLNMLYPLHIVFGMKKPCPPLTIGTDRAQSRTLYTSILARVVMDFKSIFKKLISDLTFNMCMYA